MKRTNIREGGKEGWKKERKEETNVVQHHSFLPSFAPSRKKQETRKRGKGGKYGEGVRFSILASSLPFFLPSLPQINKT
jgi:hypothetical protein